MGKHEKDTIREWYADKKWKAKHGEYDWMIPIAIAIIGYGLWQLVF